MGPEVLVVPGLVLLAGGGAYVAHVLERGHRRAYAALARAQGWAYAPEDGRLAHAFGGQPFGQGQRRRATDVLTGAFRGRAVAAFTYSFQTTTTDSNGQRQHVHPPVRRRRAAHAGLPAARSS